MRCIDGSVLDEKRLDEALRRIELYRKIKNGGMYDDFYESHLITFETAIEELRKSLQKNSSVEKSQLSSSTE